MSRLIRMGEGPVSLNFIRQYVSIRLFPGIAQLLPNSVFL